MSNNLMSRRRFLLTAGAFTGAAVLTACGSGQTSNEAGTDAGGGAHFDSKAAKATSLADVGGLAGLEALAKEEGHLNLIALTHDWSNWGEVIATFKTKYPEIQVHEANTMASSKEEIDAIKTNAGTDKAPDCVDVSPGVAAGAKSMFAPYKVAAWNDIPAEHKEASGLFVADYTGIMTIGWNKTKYGDIKSIDELQDSRFAGTVALNGKPYESGAAFGGYLMFNLGKGGDLRNLDPALDYFKKLKEAGTLTTVDVTNATIDSGQTGVVADWTYNQASTKARLKEQGVDWEYVVFPGQAVASYYCQAVNKQAPHPACARLWQEFLYTPEAQNLWLKGGSLPVLLNKMKAEGTVNEEYLSQQIKLPNEPLTYSIEDNTRITKWLQEHWDQAIGN